MITRLVGQERRKISQFYGYSGYNAWSVHVPHAERRLLTMQAGSHYYDCWCPTCIEECRFGLMKMLMMGALYGKFAVAYNCAKCEEAERIL